MPDARAPPHVFYAAAGLLLTPYSRHADLSDAEMLTVRRALALLDDADAAGTLPPVDVWVYPGTGTITPAQLSDAWLRVLPPALMGTAQPAPPPGPINKH